MSHWDIAGGGEAGARRGREKISGISGAALQQVDRCGKRRNPWLSMLERQRRRAMAQNTTESALAAQARNAAIIRARAQERAPERGLAEAPGEAISGHL